MRDVMWLKAMYDKADEKEGVRTKYETAAEIVDTRDPLETEERIDNDDDRQAADTRYD
jgi:hypothetical protein